MRRSRDSVSRCVVERKTETRDDLSNKVGVGDIDEIGKWSMVGTLR